MNQNNPKHSIWVTIRMCAYVCHNSENSYSYTSDLLHLLPQVFDWWLHCFVQVSLGGGSCAAYCALPFTMTYLYLWLHMASQNAMSRTSPKSKQSRMESWDWKHILPKIQVTDQLTNYDYDRGQHLTVEAKLHSKEFFFVHSKKLFRSSSMALSGLTGHIIEHDSPTVNTCDLQFLKLRKHVCVRPSLPKFKELSPFLWLLNKLEVWTISFAEWKTGTRACIGLKWRFSLSILSKRDHLSESPTASLHSWVWSLGCLLLKPRKVQELHTCDMATWSQPTFAISQDGFLRWMIPLSFTLRKKGCSINGGAPISW